MEKWARMKYQPCIPLGKDRSCVTGSKEHIAVSRRAACEGTVLLKNEKGTLPLAPGSRVALFGMGQIDYVKGGGGSGDVYCEYVKNIYDGLRESGLSVYEPLSEFYRERVAEAYKKGGLYGRLREADVPKELISGARAFTDTAIIAVCRFSGENWDRKADGSDPYFELSAEEKKTVDAVCADFPKVIVLLNTGAMIDTSWFADNGNISAALMIWQGGMEGGLAAGDVLTGREDPSGRLTDTCARSISDYPSTAGFYESPDFVKYTEDVFVGYRYFETVPGMKEKVVYPFGYGLSYTRFEIKNVRVSAADERITVTADVENRGERPGREVVQVYFKAPEGRITKPARALCAFKKTKKLAPGETETVEMSFPVSDMASYDDTGAVRRSAYVLEAGEYSFFVGRNVRDAAEAGFKYALSENVTVRVCEELCAPERLGRRLTASGEYISVPDVKRVRRTYPPAPVPGQKEREGGRALLSDVWEGRLTLDGFLEQLSLEELRRLTVACGPRGVANTDGLGDMKEYGIPAAMTADGPAGIRIKRQVGVATTAFPIATMLACTWDPELVERVGVCCAREAKENNLSVWLAPALNIHRSPLCGRNFEYYSEDPLVSGRMAAAIVRGVQSQNIAATPKHFACNNKETNRKESDSVLSERALREIYIRGFEICVRESAPDVIMTSYNIINGVRASENAELITGILRGEWGYRGLVITDWWNTADRTAEVKAGNDIRMPSTMNDRKTPFVDVVENKNTRAELVPCVRRLLELILRLD